MSAGNHANPCLTLLAGIVARGDTPFLHAIATNVTAIRLYKELGFTHRRDIQFPLLRRAATR